MKRRPCPTATKQPDNEDLRNCCGIDPGVEGLREVTENLVIWPTEA